MSTTIPRYANHQGHTDVTPFEVVRVISETTIEIREMDSKLAEGEKPHFLQGGFAAHCTNQRELKYDITSNPSNRVIRIRKSTNGWGKGKFRLSDTPIRFYDYNF
ncbi:MAG: hypothetical protein ACRC2H_01075 [Silanimonas sp.]